MKEKNENIKRKPLKPREKIVFEKSEYAVVEFIDDRIKLFESIPESWFINEERSACYWPPKTGRSFKLRAINQDIPDLDWEIYECIVVSEGHATYSIASRIVREKCSQRYNTSSADDHEALAKYKREHPGLIQKGEKSFENLFQKTKSKTINDQEQKSIDCEKIISLVSPSDIQNNSKDDFNSNIDLNGNVERHSQNSVPYDSGNKYSSSVESRREINKCRSGSRQQSSGSIRQPSLHSTHSSRAHRSSHSSPSSQRNRSRSSQRIGSERSSRCSSQHSSRRSSKSSKTRSRSRSSQRIRSERSSRCSSQHSSRRSSKSSEIRSRSRSSQRNRSEKSSSRRSSKSSNNRSRSRSSQRNRSERSSRHSIRHSSLRSSKPTNNRNRSRSSQRNRSESERSSRHSSRHLSNRSNRNSRSRELTRERQRNRYAFSQRSGTPLSYISTSPGTSKKTVNKPLSRGRGKPSNRNFSELSSSVRQPSNSKVDQQENYTHRHRQSKQCNSSFRLTCDRPTSTVEQLQGQQNHLKTIMNNVNQLTIITMKNEHRNKQYDHRISRMEVTVNKSFVLIGDLVNAFNMRMSLGHFSREVPIPKGYEMPELPIERQRDLRNLNHDLKNKDFLLFLINDQKQYCTPSQQLTDTVVMTAFLKKFISLDIRAKVVMKDLKGQDGLTLCANFPRVYDFIIQVFKAGYEIRNKVLTNKEVHSVLRVVWGRSKQMLNEENQRLRN